MAAGQNLHSTGADSAATEAAKPEWTTGQVVDNMLRLDLQWQTPTVNFQFATSGAFNATQKAAAALAFQYLADVIDLQFAQVSYSSQLDGRITFGNGDLGAGLWGDAHWTYSTQQVGGYSPMAHAEITVNSDYTGVHSTYDFGTYDFMSMFHEIGHALGLAHPGTYDEGGGSYSADAAYVQDTRQYTVMSYFDASNSGADHDGHFASTPLLHDVMVLQALYGANTTTRTGNTTYGFHDTSGRDAFNFSVNSHPVVAIWDAGGNDTIDLSGYSMACNLDLNEGAFSDVGGMVANLAVCFNATIENGTGGSGNDVITGTDAANKLTGNDGNDTLKAGSGNDSLFGGAGNDTFIFGTNFTSADSVSGGLGVDSLSLTGNYTSLTFANATSIEAFALGAGFNYTFVLTDGTVAANSTLTINASALGGSNSLKVDGALETNGKLVLTGGAGNDVLTGGAGADTLKAGLGVDVLVGGAGNDTLGFESGFAANDTVTGGTGVDTLSFNGDYAALNFGVNVTGIEALAFGAGHNYNVNLTDLTVAAGSMTVDAGALAAANTFKLNASNVILGSLDVTGGAGADSFTFGASFTTADNLRGGGGTDTLFLDGDYSFAFTAKMMTAIEALALSAGHDYNFAFTDGVVANNMRLTVNANDLRGGDALVLDGSGEMDGRFTFNGGAGNDSFVGGGLGDIFAGGAGNDTIMGGAGLDLFTGGLGADTLNGGANADTFIYGNANESLGANGHDTLVGFDFSGDLLDLGTTVRAIDADVEGKISTSSFETDLATLAGRRALFSDHAILVTANSGSLAGEQFLIVDMNGKAGYQAAQDMVFHLDGALHQTNLDVHDFI